MHTRGSLSILLVTLVLLLGSSALASLPGHSNPVLGIHPVAAAPVPNVLGLDCAYGSNTEGGVFPSSVTTPAPYTAPDFDGTLDSSCMATYLGDTDGALHPLVSDNPGGTIVAGSGGGLTIDVVASLNSTTTINGFDISVQYDPHYLNGVIIDQSGLIWGGAGLPPGGFVLGLAKTIDNVNGVARVAQVLVGAPLQGGATELFRVRFDLVGASPSTPVHIVSDTLTNPGNVRHNTNAATSIDTTIIYNTLTGIPAGMVASTTFSPTPEVPLSTLTFTATATCPGCTGVLTYSWDFSSNDATTYVAKSQSTANPAIVSPPPPVVNRVTVTITDAAVPAHSFAITRVLPLVAKEAPAATIVARKGLTSTFTGQWLGGITTAAAAYTGSWTFCPGSALNKQVCSNPSVSFSQTPATVTQTSTAAALSYNFAGLFNETFKVTDTAEQQVGTIPTGNSALLNFFVNVTGTPRAYSVNLSGDKTSITVGQAINFTVFASYTANYTTSRSNSFRYVWDFGDGSPTVTTSPLVGNVSSLVHTYSAVGPHTVKVTATETANNAVAHIVENGFLQITVGSGMFSAPVSGPSTGSVNQMLTYNAVTSGGTLPFTYAWAVTGGSPASGTSASFMTSFAAKGTYNVTLTVTDNTGKTAKAFELVTITPLALIVAVSGPTTGTVNTAVPFTSSVSGGTTPYTYAWAVTGGSPASGTASTFSSTFAVKGTYNITLTVTDHNGALKTAFQLVSISPLALTVSISGPTTGMVGTAVSFTSTVSGGTSPYTYAWAVTGGSPSTGTASSFSTTFANHGTYNVTLTVTDHNGKTAETFQLVNISAPTLTASISGPTSGAVNQMLTFNAVVSGGTTPYTYSWSVTGGSPSTGTASTFSTTFSVKGSFNVTLTVTDASSTKASTFQLVAISPLPLTASISGPTSGSVNVAVSFTSTVSGGTTPYVYAWAVTGGTPGSGTASTFSSTFAVKGTYNVTLTVTDHNGKTASTFHLVVISSTPLLVTVGGPTTGTVGATLTFTSTVSGGTSPYAYAWAVTGGNPASGTGSSFAASFAVKGTYNVTLTVTDHNGAKTIAFQLVSISPLSLTTSVSGPTSGAVNQMLTFNAVVSGGTTPYTYAWAVTGGTPASSTATSFTTSFAVKGTYNVTLTVTDHNAATAKAFKLVVISPLTLTASVTGPTTGSVNQVLTFNAVVSGGTTPYTYSWAVTGGNPASGTTSSFPTSFSSAAIYNVTLTVTDHNGKTSGAFELVSISGVALSASISGPASGTINQMLTFNAVVSGGTSPFTYAWAVTGGSPATGTASSFTTIFAVKGTYNVTLTVTDNTAKTAKTFQLVTISPVALTARITGPTTGTVGATLTFNSVVSGGTTPYAYSWAVTGGSPASATASSFATSFAVKGTYNVTLTVTDNNAATAKTFQLVTISPLPLTVSVSGPATGTVGAGLAFSAVVTGGTTPYTYAWAATGGNPASGTTSGFTTSFAVKGTYNVTLTVTDHNAKTASAFQLVIISPLTLTASVSGPTTGTISSSLTFNAVVSGGTAPYTYAWAVTGGNPASGTASSFTTSFAVSGMYNVTLTVTDQNAKSVSAFQLVTISPVTTTGDFSVLVNPSHLSLLAGNSRNVTIIVQSFNFAGTVTLTVTITPVVANGPSATLSKSTLTLVINSTMISKLRLSTLASTPPGSYVVNVSATSGALSHSATTILTVKGFSLTATPSSLTVQAGSSGVFHVALESQGFAGVVHLTADTTTVADQKPRLSLSNSNVFLSSDGTASTTLRFSSDEQTPLGTYTITINATGHGLTHSSSVNVTVTDSAAVHLHHHSHHHHGHHHD